MRDFVDLIASSELEWRGFRAKGAAAIVLAVAIAICLAFFPSQLAELFQR